MRCYTTLIVFFLSLTYTSLHAQYSDAEWEKIMTTYSESELLIESSRLLEEGYFNTAEKIVDKLLVSAPENSNYNYRKGFLLAEGKSNFVSAVPYLEKGAKNIRKNFDMFSASETGAAIDCYYHLAKSLHRSGNLDKAEVNYNLFLANATSSKTELAAAAKLGLEQIKVARLALQYPKQNVEIVNLGNQVNSNLPEYSPVVSFDGSALFFTSRRAWDSEHDKQTIDPRYDFYPEDVYVSYKDVDSSWTDPERLSFCKADQNEAAICVSVNERRIYVYQDLVGNGDLFFSEFADNRFKEIKSYPEKEVNTKYWETHCYVTPDGRNMYFTSDRPGGFGGRDIYRIVKLPNGQWSQAFNLGPQINTPFDEEAPFMANDNKTLYFASNGPKSMGGFDILVTFIDESNNWTDPVNLGSPVNSTDDDLFYTETIDGRRGYITSIRPNSKGQKDIYEIRNDYLSSERGTIFTGKIITLNDAKLPEDITVTLNCKNCDTDLPITVYPRLRDGAFYINLDPCHTYDVVVHHNDGKDQIYNEPLSTDCNKKKEELYREMFLDVNTMTISTKQDTVPVIDTNTTTKPDTTAPIAFEPLRFKHNYTYNSAKLSASDGPLNDFLTKAEAQLKNGKKELVIEVYSSASQVPTVTFKNNQLLTQARAKNIKKEVESYFAVRGYAKKVTVKIISAVVAGPAYDKDKDNEARYIPYQFIELKTK